MQPFDCICEQDYEGENCERTTSPPPSATLPVESIIGGVVGGLLVLIVFLLAIIGLLLLWKRRRKAIITGMSEYINNYDCSISSQNPVSPHSHKLIILHRECLQCSSSILYCTCQYTAAIDQSDCNYTFLLRFLDKKNVIATRLVNNNYLLGNNVD